MKDDLVNLRDMLESAKIAMKYVQDKNYEEFHLDTQFQDAVIRRLEIVGEAAR
jgi:uncharacterized protein with HEPN domain